MVVPEPPSVSMWCCVRKHARTNPSQPPVVQLCTPPPAVPGVRRCVSPHLHSAPQLTDLGTDLLHSLPHGAENLPLCDWIWISSCLYGIERATDMRTAPGQEGEPEQAPCVRGSWGGGGGLSRSRPRGSGARSRPSAEARPCAPAWRDDRCRGSRTGGRSRAANTERSTRFRAP